MVYWIFITFKIIYITIIFKFFFIYGVIYLCLAETNLIPSYWVKVLEHEPDREIE